MAPTTNDSDLPFWLRPPAVALFVLVLLAIRLFVAAESGLVRDEAYYALWSLHPQWGYMDHPPMIGWLVGLGRLVTDSPLSVRLLASLSTAVTSFALYRTGRLLFDPKTAAVAVIWFNLTLAMGLLFVATPDAPVVMFWSLSIWAVAEFVARRNPNWWLLAGLFAGLALQSKYTAALLGVGLVLYLISSRERWRWLLHWQVWAGGGLALLVVLPNLLWNAANGWLTLGFQGQRIGSRNWNLDTFASFFGEFLAGQVLALGVFLFIFVVIGAVAFFRRAELPGCANLALPLFTGLPILIFFAIYTLRYRAEANWPLPAWPMLSLVGAWAAVHVRPRNWLAGGVLAVFRHAQAPLGALLLAVLYIQAVWQPFEVPPLLDRTRDMRGWEELEREVALFREREDARWIAVGPWDYGLAGELTLHGRWMDRQPLVWGTNEAPRWSFLPPLGDEVASGPALMIVTTSMGSGIPERYFAQVEMVGEARRMQGEEELERFFVYRVSEPLPALREVLGHR